MINPINHALDADGVEKYMAEPLCDECGCLQCRPRHSGRAGWSWYTGSAGWAYRLLTEELLGIKRGATSFTVHPLLPASWPSFALTYQYRDSQYRITVSRGDGQYQATLDGPAPPPTIPFRCWMTDSPIASDIIQN
ncbi:Cellobiose phosphorylase [Raoultella planticola]|uniref:Cellobiose phosphorylase n=1 Tax=Raoultella planticola TaxID=575 RepID=A0A485D626_RAOPL|nr:Cellobiose phosphorylase [Raoultella planticola]